MRKAVFVVAALAVAVVGVLGLRSETSYQADEQAAGTVSLVTVTVSTKGSGGVEADARVLWAICSRTLNTNQRAAAVSVAGDVLRAEVRPGLGDDQQHQLTGCLEDLTLRLVQGSDVSIETSVDP